MASPKNGVVEEFASFVSFWINEAMRAVVEGAKVFVFCHFWENEAMRAVVKGAKVFISCHFWEMRR